MSTLQYGEVLQVVLAAEQSLKDRMIAATYYTVLGMAIVFAVLILIILLISAFKFLPNNQAKKVSNEVEENKAYDNVISQIADKEEELSSDLELVAVITAAIHAYRGEASPKGGFVVRSIRKINRR
ncbi:MAG TPA: OadG family protein [Clostridiales bacterium]|nr:OadG family protein [Clostridiales bacterium]